MKRIKEQAAGEVNGVVRFAFRPSAFYLPPFPMDLSRYDHSDSDHGAPVVRGNPATVVNAL